MELRSQTIMFESAVQSVDAVGDVKCRALLSLREEVADWTIHRSRDPHGDAVYGYQRERSVNGAYRVGVAAQHAAPRFLNIHVCDAIEIGLEEIDDATDGREHPDQSIAFLRWSRASV